MSEVKKLQIKEKIDFLKYPNVVGFSNKVKDNKITVYVSKKVPERELKLGDVLPSFVEGIEIKVVEIGEVRALSEPQQGKFRPLIPGTSIGHAQITAGTLGWVFEKGTEEFLGSNAHVFHPDPSSENAPSVLDILQPGAYDGGKKPEDKVANYHWHQHINGVGTPSTCSVSNIAVKIANAIAGLKWKTRFTTYVDKTNYQDFAVATLDASVEYELKNYFFDPVALDYPFLGLCFAGSNMASMICKAQYQVAAGYIPKGVDVGTVAINETIRKGGRTTGDTEGIVLDESIDVQVGYGNFTATISDVIMTTKCLDGGDSGSGAWKKVI